MGSGSGIPRGARIIVHQANELLIQQDCVPDRDIILAIQEGTQHTHSLIGILSDLVDLRQPVESCI